MRLIVALLYWLAIWPAYADTLPLLGVGSGAASAGFTITKICQSAIVTSGTTITCVTSGTIPAGDTIVVYTGWKAASGIFTSVSDTGINAYTLMDNATNSPTFSRIMYVLNPTSVPSGTTYTWTLSAAIVYGVMTVSYINKTTAAGLHGNSTGSSTTPTCATSGSIASGSFGFGIVMHNSNGSTMASPGGWTDDYNSGTTDDLIASHIITSGAGTLTYNPTGYSTSSVWACTIGSFQ